MAKHIKMQVRDTVLLRKGDEEIEVELIQRHSGGGSTIGIHADTNWRIELFHQGKLVEGLNKKGLSNDT